MRYNKDFFIYLYKLNKLKERKSTKLKTRSEKKKHSRIESSGRKARHFTGTDTLALLTVMEVGTVNQAHTRVGTYQAISRIHERGSKHIKPWKL